MEETAGFADREFLEGTAQGQIRSPSTQEHTNVLAEGVVQIRQTSTSEGSQNRLPFVGLWTSCKVRGILAEPPLTVQRFKFQADIHTWRPWHREYSLRPSLGQTDRSP